MKIDTAVQPTKAFVVKNPVNSTITSVLPGSTAFVSHISTSMVFIRFPIEGECYFLQITPKQFVKTFVQNEKVAEAMNTFIDAQSSYTKQAAKVGTDTFATLTSEMVKTTQEAMKFDYTKFGEGIMKAYQTTQKPAKGA